MCLMRLAVVDATGGAQHAIETFEPFAERLHIDLADGQFAPSTLIDPAELWWPEGKTIDVHVMYQRPEEVIQTLISQNPQTIILHSESEGDVLGLLEHVKETGITPGIAILMETDPS